MEPSLPPVIPYEKTPGRLRNDLLNRLRWDIFGSLKHILVKENGIVTPFSGHHIASWSLADPPCNNLAVNIDTWA
ncbi:uncharacterized protein K460DRAFT_191775 [Cucurbitaria berberidis CBS 394.84]|uniref:Uncharacterized protein n=1 Tax=Cucurbitaria berberidis CBS 394.84 TaxID=1168544 RepID=A0A9P4G8M1_9PLEO|nr:uncharacterized protein K460DRAFT_191775 [Cucurbitaria berberidis CBS 394.84]KAF1840744.1 hypothetical protein K460DRAFT_191775 [Cucurbitaria berberidis CBS 394.84]